MKKERKKMTDNKLYTKDSIESLSPLEFTRLRPHVYAGGCTYATQLLVEIVSNAVDEFRLGHGNKIKVTIDKDIVTVRDYGQGFIPNSFREDGKTILEAAFSVLNTSGKYREDGTYEGTSLGSFGIGSKLVVFLSHWACISTYRDGQREEIIFKEGVFDKRYNAPPATKEAKDDVAAGGTEVSWQPSEEFFTHTEVEINKVKSLFKTITALCSGLTIELNDNGEITSYYSKSGLSDLVDSTIKNKEIIKNRLILNYAEGKYKMDLVLTYTTDYTSTIVPYVNTGLTEAGPHITQLKTILTREFNKYLKAKKILKDKDEALGGDDIQEGMYLIFNLTAPNIGYDSQVKTKVTKIEMKPFSQAFVDALNAWFAANEKDIKNIADKAINARKARAAAKKARDAVRNTNEKKQKALKFDSKLADCYSKERGRCELYVVEGK
jgi:DNA gyrase/topoisomerase IV subunit B